jgi:hypothetical protein
MKSARSKSTVAFGKDIEFQDPSNHRVSCPGPRSSLFAHFRAVNPLSIE